MELIAGGSCNLDIFLLAGASVIIGVVGFNVGYHSISAS